MTLAIYCAGGLGKEIIALARSVNIWNEIIFVDDITDADWHAGAKVFRFDELRGYNDELEFIIATGEPAVREALYNGDRVQPRLYDSSGGEHRRGLRVFGGRNFGGRSYRP